MVAAFPMSVLFDRLRLPGPDLLLRAYGHDACPILEEALLAVPDGETLALDFQGVSVMDTSFADETVLELALGLVGNRYGERYLVLGGPSQATIENLEGTIARRKAKVALLVRNASGLAILGHVEPNLTETWRLVRKSVELTARELANCLELEINTASMRLRKLHTARLLRRKEEISAEGRQHVYAIPG